METASAPFRSVPRQPTLVETVAQELTEAIVSGKLASGERLPSERDLGEQFDVSRTVVREAVRSLAARGLVTVTSGRGVEVAKFDASTVAESLRLFIRGKRAFDYGQIHEVRSTLEVQTAGLASERATPEDISTLETLCVELDQHLQTGDYTSASRVDFDFHRALAAATHNELFLIMLDSVGDVLREVRDRAYPKHGVGESGLKEHREILRHVADGDAAAARQAMTAHLAHAESIWLEAEKSRATTPTGKDRG